MAALLPEKSNSISEASERDNPSLLQGGRSYQLGNSKVPHLLPSPGKLKPYVDRISGNMETWPANSNLMSPDEKLEAYMNKELRVLGCTDDTPSEKRLQVFREVFERLIDDFRTYKPILSCIKQEYESMLTFQKEGIRRLEPLKAMLVNVNDKCEQRVLTLKQEDKKELALANKRNVDLENVISSLKEEIETLKQQVKQCQEEVEESYKKYRDESDSKKLLIQSLNDLKYLNEDNTKKTPADEDAKGEEEDCVFLRIALKKAREDLTIKNRKIAEIMADYGDVVPRRDFEKMEIQFINSKDQSESMKSDYDKLLKEHSILLEVHEKTMEQRDSLSSNCERMRVSATPRPDWDKCGQYIEGGHERWIEISSGKSTNDKLDIILAEITGEDIEAVQSGATGGADLEFFEPKGDTEDIAPYLRSTEKVRNKYLGVRDLLVMVKDIWRRKMKDEGCTPFTEHTPIKTYFYNYLKQCFGAEDIVIEWGYNIDYALKKYNYDFNICLFGSILNGELDEDIYYNNLNQLESLYHIFAAADADDRACLSKDEFQQCISSYCPYLSNENLSSLVKSAEDELKTCDGVIMYRDLFNEDDGGNTGPFVNLLQVLLKQDKEAYLKEVELQLGNEVSRVDLAEAFLAVSPNLGKEICGTYVNLGFRVSSSEKVDVQVIIQNLRRSCIKRIC